MSDNLEARYDRDLACAFIRGRLPGAPELPPAGLFRHGEAAGLRLHKFKRSALLPRVRRVFGYLRQLAPVDLLDVGSGRRTSWRRCRRCGTGRTRRRPWRR